MRESAPAQSGLPPKGRRLLSMILVASPMVAIAGLVMRFWLHGPMPLAVIMQVPFGASIVYLMRTGPRERSTLE